MAFAKITDGVTDMDGVIFPNIYFTDHPKLTSQALVVRGRMDERKGQPQLIIEKVDELETFKDEYLKRIRKIYIRNKDRYDFDELLDDNGIVIYSFEDGRILGNIDPGRLKDLQDKIHPVDLRFMT